MIVNDSAASGVPGLSTITRPDGSLQASFQGRPLYFFNGDTGPGTAAGDGLGGVWHVVPYSAPTYTPLFGPGTTLEPELQEDTPSALITRLSDRARPPRARGPVPELRPLSLLLLGAPDHGDRDRRHRRSRREHDHVQRGCPVAPEPDPGRAPLPLRGLNTVAEYFDNGIMNSVPGLDVPGSNVKHYTRSISFNPKEGRALRWATVSSSS